MFDKRFTINMIAQIIAFAVNLGIGFFLTPFIVNNIGKEAYGFVALANNFVGYAQLITIVLNSMASRFVTISIHKKDILSANQYFSSVYYANIIVFVLIMLASVGLVVNLNAIINIPEELLVDVRILYALVFLNFGIGLISSVYGIATFASNRLDLVSIRSIISNIIKVLILLISFIFFLPNVWYIGLAALISTLYVAITNLLLTKRLLPNLKVEKKYIDLQKIKELLRSGFWNGLSKLSVILSTGLDLLIANIFINAAAMGTLSIAKMMPTLILSVFAMFANVFAPKLTIDYAKGFYDDVKMQLLSSMKFLGFLASIPIAILFAYGDIFFKLWVPNEDYYLIHILSILTCFELCFALPQENLWNIFTITNKVKASSLSLLLMSVLIVACVFVAMQLAPSEYRIYYLGGITSLFGTIRLLTFLPIFGAKSLNLKWTTFYPILLKNVASIVVLTLISLVIRSLLNNSSSWGMLIGYSLLTSFFGIFVNYFFILSVSDRYLLKRRISHLIIKYRRH